MTALKKLSLYFHTIKYLKIKQLVYRVRHRYKKPYSSKKPIEITLRQKNHTAYFLEKNFLYLNENTGFFLNHTVDISSNTIWNDINQEKLWLYQLHYFDALNAKNHSQRVAAITLLNRWIIENPCYSGIGWDAFPTSLRIVNTIKYAISNHSISKTIKNSLVLQSRYLNKNCEYHILGNHLFENYKALCFAGLFFNTPESKRWFKKGLAGLKKEIPEQILSDGGHFELSPMYHIIFLEGLLDILTLFRCYNRESDFIWHSTIEKMLAWITAIERSNHEIPHFNDATNGMASSIRDVLNYSHRMGFSIPSIDEALTQLSTSGYIIFQNSCAKLLIDAGQVGPTYLPAHAHADTLSFELCIDAQPVFVNTGTSCYGNSDRRAYERSSPAHNTLVVNNQNSSQVWSGFRVGKRARAINVQAYTQLNGAIISAMHTGYQSIHQNLLHKRTWHVTDHQLIISDQLTREVDNAVIYFHLHPQCNITLINSHKIEIGLSHRTITFSSQNPIEMIESKYAQGFGQLIPAKTLKIAVNKENRVEIRYSLAEAQTCINS